jgi:hypothetical protein
LEQPPGKTSVHRPHLDNGALYIKSAKMCLPRFQSLNLQAFWQ